MTLKELKEKYLHASKRTWHQHPNGGGWVENTATVEKTVYVGPDAVVYGRAQVMDRAVIGGWASVSDNAIVKAEARIGGFARVIDDARVEGNAVVYDHAIIYSEARVHDSATIGGNANIGGKARVYGPTKVCGHARINASVCLDCVIRGQVLLMEGKIVEKPIAINGLRWPVNTERPKYYAIGCRVMTHEGHVKRYRSTEYEGSCNENEREQLIVALGYLRSVRNVPIPWLNVRKTRSC